MSYCMMCIILCYIEFCSLAFLWTRFHLAMFPKRTYVNCTDNILFSCGTFCKQVH